MPKLFIYIIALIPLAFATERIRATLGDVLTLVVVVGYLLGVRIILDKFGASGGGASKD